MIADLRSGKCRLANGSKLSIISDMSVLFHVNTDSQGSGDMRSPTDPGTIRVPWSVSKYGCDT